MSYSQFCDTSKASKGKRCARSLTKKIGSEKNLEAPPAKRAGSAGKQNHSLTGLEHGIITGAA